MARTVYPLKPESRVLPIVWTLFFATVAYFAFGEATDPSESFRFRGVTTSGWTAALLHWSGFALTSAFALLGIFVLFLSFKGETAVEVTGHSIIVPAFSFRGARQREIPFASIRSVDLVEVRGNIYLEIEHVAGKQSLPMNSFRTQEDFDAICDLLLPEVEDEDDPRYDAADDVSRGTGVL